jgi:predicted MFS family arabinose efflux permease
MNMAQPLITNFSLEMTHEDDHPLMSGIMTVAWLASWGISANLGGRLIENTGYFLPFNLTLVAYILSSLAYFILLLPMEKKSDTINTI